MAGRKKPEVTIPDLQKQIRQSFKRWEHIRRYGAGDPNWADGANMHLVRNHILHDQGKLKELCKAQKVRPCPAESKLKPPKQVSWDFCAPKSKAGPCVERRKSRRKSV